MIAVILLALGLWCCGDGYRIPWANPVPPVPNPVWNDTTRTVYLSGGRGEVLGFQVVIPAQFDTLTAGDTVEIRPDTVHVAFMAASDLYRNGATAPASWQYFWTRAVKVTPKRPTVPGRLGAGWYLEQLEPLGDYFSVGEWEPRAEALWVDLTVPDVPPGEYWASIAIRADGVQDAFTLRLKVHNFTIEDPALPMAVGFSLPKLEQVTHRPWHETITPFFEMARDHHLSLMVRGWPDLYPDSPMEWAEHDSILGPWIPEAKTWLLPAPAYYRLPYVAFDDSFLVAHRVKVMEDHWRAKGWPLSRGLLWMYDEPRTKTWCLYPSELLGYAQSIREATDSIRIMVTERPDTTIVGAADVIASKADLCRSGVGRWAYQSYEGGLPLCVIDAPATAFRLWPWVAAKYRLPGVFYWCGNSWSTAYPIDLPDGNPQANGDGNGTLFWCGPDDEPWSSVRMKAIRRGMQDYAILEMARKQGQASVVLGMLSGTVRKGLWEGRDWEMDPSVLDARIETLRGRLR